MPGNLQNDSLIHPDEPTAVDRLDREKYADALTKMAMTCDTPLVIGLYGSWGIGKTSLMMQIQEKLKDENVLCVWFDPWQHQFDENPALSLAHALYDRLDDRLKDTVKKNLITIGTAFSSMLTKHTTGLSAKDIGEFFNKYEEERFQIREKQVRLREHFQKIVDQAKKNSSLKEEKTKRPFIGRLVNGFKKKVVFAGTTGELHRLIFFIDDLDRCTHDSVLKLLEALKLYLNIPGCVYFLGVDRNALEFCIQERYKSPDFNEAEYLDKIVQLPFSVPPIESKTMDGFVDKLIPSELKSCMPILVAGLGNNPRQIKRFINTLSLNHELAKSVDIQPYDPLILAIILLIQVLSHKLYKKIEARPDLLVELKIEINDYDQSEDPGETSLNLKLLPVRLWEVLRTSYIPDGEGIQPYIYLTYVAPAVEEETKERRGSERISETVSTEESVNITKKEFLADAPPDFQKILEDHQVWLSSNGGKGVRADFTKMDLTKAILRGVNLREAELSFCWLDGAQLQKSNLMLANLRKASMIGANLSYANLQSARMLGADLRDADLQGANLIGAKLIGVNLSRSKLMQTDFRGASLMGAILKEVDLRESGLEGATLNGADILNANLKGAIINEADLSGTDLTRANLHLSEMKGVNLSKSVLTGAKLTMANLEGSSFIDADLDFADLGDANVKGTDFSGASLKSAKINDFQLSFCITSEETILPDGSRGPFKTP